MNQSNQLRVVFNDQYHHDQNGVNEKTLTNSKLVGDEKLQSQLVFLQGMWENNKENFPLTFLTEGSKSGYTVQEIMGEDFSYDVVGKLKRTSFIQSGYTSASTAIGANGTPVTLIMKDKTLIVQHIVKTPNNYYLRVLNNPVPVQGGYWQYTLQKYGSDYSSIPYTELSSGTLLVQMGGAIVSSSGSVGNNSNVQTPGKMKGCLSTLRKSFRYEGNLKHRTANCTFQTSAGSTQYFVPFFRWQYGIEFRKSIEEHLWISKFNKNLDGTTSDGLYDETNNKPIFTGAGVFEQIPHQDTYSVMTADKLKRIVRNVLYGAKGIGNMNIVLYTGTGGMEEFDRAMKVEALGYSQITGDKFITGSGRNLTIGGFFTSYQHIDGHVITCVKLNMLDDLEGYAANSPLHPKTGLPICSYDYHFIDHTSRENDGGKNIKMVLQKGRVFNVGIVKGMAALGDKAVDYNFAGNDDYEAIATEQDNASVHAICTKHITITNTTHCFSLRCNIS